MKDITYHAIAAYEDSFWWHRIRRELSAGLLLRAGLQPGASAVDVGCGTGGTLLLYAHLRVGRAVGIDRSEAGLAIARSRSADALFVRADASAPLPLRSGEFDLATVFGVLNHQWIADETRVMGEVARLLRPGGLLLVTEPAFPSLTRGMDRFGMTRRRYRPGEISAFAAAPGLEVLRQGHFAAWAFLPAWMLARLERLVPKRSMSESLPLDLREPHPWVNLACYGVSRLELAMTLAGVNLPFGVTFFGLYRKPPAH